jgi:hypothetical protein
MELAVLDHLPCPFSRRLPGGCSAGQIVPHAAAVTAYFTSPITAAVTAYFTAPITAAVTAYFTAPVTAAVTA